MPTTSTMGPWPTSLVESSEVTSDTAPADRSSARWAMPCTCATQLGVGSIGSPSDMAVPCFTVPMVAQMVGMTTVPSGSAP